MIRKILFKHHLLPALGSVILLGFCYPGFMSYDSIRMLEEARTHVIGGIYPPGPVYILRLFDVLGHGVTLMIFFQNYLVLFSLNALLVRVGASFLQTAISLFLFLAMPTVVGAMLVLWKDVTLASVMAAALAIIYVDYDRNLDRKWKWGMFLSLIMIVFSATIRFNAITATSVLIIFWISVYLSERSILAKAGAFIGATVMTIIIGSAINNFRLPSLLRLEPNNLAYAVMSYDLVGISKWSRVSFVPFDNAAGEKSEKSRLADIDKIYSSLGAVEISNRNASLKNLVKVYPPGYSNEDIFRAWISAIIEAPLSYIRYRWDLFSEIIGATNHETFEPTHFGKIDANGFSITFRDNYLTTALLRYIKIVSSLFIGKPWFFFLITLMILLFSLKRDISHKKKVLSVYSFIASMAYIVPFSILSGTGEVRYTYPSIVFGMMSMFGLFAKDGDGKKDCG